MRRMHLVELEDLPGCPGVLRDGGTAYIEFVARASGHSARLLPKLEETLRATGRTRIVDLCSGGGGPVRLLSDALHERGVAHEVVLTDRYPNANAFAHATQGAEGRVSGRLEPVDATAVPAELTGLRTIFNAFHHFRPEQARAVLADAVARREPIAVFELVSREPLMLGGLLFSPIPVTLTMPFWRPFRWPWVFLAWVVPVLQLFVLWDGVVSWLRIYGQDELRELVAGIDAPDWEWDIGTIDLVSPPAHASYLVGRPKA